MKKTLMILISCLMSMVTTATPVTKEHAKEAAKAFLMNRSQGHRAAASMMLKEPQLLGKDKDGQPLAYAFNMGHNQGFVLVSGSDVTDAVIGYSDEGEIDVQRMPENMRAWLQAYEASVKQMKAKGERKSRRAAERVVTRSSIGPLLKSEWDQYAPYYNMTPVMMAWTGEEMHALTGCAITAMAQIMYYHQWPKEATKPIPAYTDSPYPNAPQLSALEPCTFDWSKIYPTYKNNENGDEVAKLMLYLGTASKTDYGVESTSVTGYDVLKAMINYFGYDAGAQVIWRNQKTYDEWLDMLYQELMEKRPVFYSGTAKDGAHAFVIDGYSEDDFFHVNWGWGGQSNGYYRVVMLDPKNQGAGGSTSDEAYKNYQVGFFGVKPATAEGKPQAARLTVLKGKLYYAPQGVDDWNTETEGYEYQSADGSYTLLPRVTTRNFTTVNGAFDMGLRLVKDDGSFSKDYAWDKMNHIDYKIDQAVLDFTGEFFTFNPKQEGMTDGDYKLYFLSKASGEKEWQLDENWDKVYVQVKLDDAHGRMTTQLINIIPQLEVDKVSFSKETIIVREPVTVTLTITNKGKADYHGDLFLMEKEEYKPLAAGLAVDVPAGETSDIEMEWRPDLAVEKDLIVVTNTNDRLKEFKVTVTPTQYHSAKLDITHRVANATDDKKIGGKYANLIMTVTNNDDNDYRNMVLVVTQYMMNGTNEPIREESTSKEIIVPAHQTIDVQIQSSELEGADTYSFTYYYYEGFTERLVPPADEGYTTSPYYVAYDVKGEATCHLATANVKPEATVCAIDLRESAGLTTSIDASANPNLLVFVDQNSTQTGHNVVKGTQAERVILEDGYPFYAPIAFTASQISYSRTPDSYLNEERTEGWSTLVLPFAATSYEPADITLMHYSHEDGSQLEFQEVEGTLEAYHPYLLGVPEKDKNGASLTFKASEAWVDVTRKSVIMGKYYKMSGAMMAHTDMADIYVLNAAGSAFVLSKASVQPFRACLLPVTDKKDAQLTIALDADELTGIHTLNHRQTIGNNIWYDLQGRPLNGKPKAKGVYIMNGKKVFY